MLEASAIKPEVMQARGYRSIETEAELKQIGFSESQLLVPTLLVPIWGVSGEIVLYHHRPDNPRMRDGKLAKYEFPAKSKMAVDVHPFLKEKVRDPNVPLFITEGVKKADAAVSLNLCCIALVGTWNWRGTNEYGGKTALPDWDSIALKDSKNRGRQVYICYDSDVMIKPQVHQALDRLSGFLKMRGASVAYIHLPSGEAAAKTGLDDYIAQGHSKDEILALASAQLRECAPAEDSRGVRAPSQATGLVALAESAGVALFHTEEHEAYATFPLEDHSETWPIRSKGFSRWLARAYYNERHTAPGAQAIQDALSVLEGQALYGGIEEPVHVRLAELGDAIYLDLANDKWQAAKITAAGWEVVDGAPVKFRRARGMLPLPLPTPALIALPVPKSVVTQGRGHIDMLRSFINVASDRDWALLIAFLVGALRPTGPYPVLVLTGEAGSAKSTTARLIRRLVDPNATPLRSEPRNPHDMMIAATNSWLPCFDNLSHIPHWLSDALCCLATGGGYSARELYSDSDETLLQATRPVVLTSIEDMATRSDLLDRSIILNLESIPQEMRQSETALIASFEAALPGILAGLLDAVACAMRNFRSIKLDRLPRMADFATWATAAEGALGLSAGAFMEAYSGNRADANYISLEAEPVVAPLMAFLEEAGGKWNGSASDLLEALNAGLPDEAQIRAREWPKRADKLSGRLKRIAPNLRKEGIDIQFARAGRAGRSIAIRTMLQSSDTSDISVTPMLTNAVLGDVSVASPTPGDATLPDGVATFGAGDATLSTSNASVARLQHDSSCDLADGKVEVASLHTDKRFCAEKIGCDNAPDMGLSDWELAPAGESGKSGYVYRVRGDVVYRRAMM